MPVSLLLLGERDWTQVTLGISAVDVVSKQLDAPPPSMLADSHELDVQFRDCQTPEISLD